MKIPFSVNAYRNIENAAGLLVAYAKQELRKEIKKATESPSESAINSVVELATAIDTVVEYFKNI